MLKFYKYCLSSGFLTFVFGLLIPTAYASTPCDQFFDSSPMLRTTATGEEQVINGNYQGVAQQYNSVNGHVTAVTFWGRVNPASGNATNTLRVKIYAENAGFPGIVLGTQSVVVDSASACYRIKATFSAPVAVSGNIIVAIEPVSPTVDDFFIQRNTHPDGQYLYLNKIKQANQWFKNLAAGGDTTLDFDFMILPEETVTLTAAFTNGATGNTTNFTNTSSNATSYLWKFGDGDTSTATSPSHNYTASATYNVTLKAFANGGACVDSVTIAVPVVITAIAPVQAVKKNGFVLTSAVVQDILTVESGSNMTIRILDVLGNQVGKYELRKDEKQQIKIDFLRPGIYLVNSENNKSVRFIKTK